MARVRDIKGRAMKVLNPKAAPATHTSAQITAAKAYVDGLPETKRTATFGEIRAAVPSVAALTDGALHALLLAGGYVVAD